MKNKRGRIEFSYNTQDQRRYFDARGKPNEAALILQAAVNLLSGLSKMDWSLLDANFNQISIW